MSWSAISLGIILLILVLVDIVATTVALRGGGIAAKYLGRFIWSLLAPIVRNRPNSPLATVTGPVLIILLFCTWSVLLWAGWTLIFSALPEAVVHGKSTAPASIDARVYYTGYVITTLGLGDYVAKGFIFQILTVVAAGLGFFFISLYAAYLIAVLSAVIDKRRLACQIFSYADSPEQLVIRAWQRSRFEVLQQLLPDLSQDMFSLVQCHLAYPVLHYFRDRDGRESPAVAVAMLDEALTLLLHGVSETHRPDPLLLQSLRTSIANFSHTVGPEKFSGSLQLPPAPRLDLLREAGIPVESDDDFNGALDKLAARRKALCKLLTHEGFEWQQVVQGGKVRLENK